MGQSNTDCEANGISGNLYSLPGINLSLSYCFGPYKLHNASNKQLMLSLIQSHCLHTWKTSSTNYYLDKTISLHFEDMKTKIEKMSQLMLLNVLFNFSFRSTMLTILQQTSTDKSHIHVILYNQFALKLFFCHFSLSCANIVVI